MEHDEQPIYRTGTLVYHQSALTRLFFLLMWGDFCFTMNSSVDPAVLPFMLDKLTASNLIISLLVTTIPAFLNFILNPIISTASDRYRSKWGRRIPFLAIATPFIVVTLILTGYAPDIGLFLQRTLGISRTIPVALIFLCAITVLYRISYLFVATTFYYLFNDVVPEAVMGRFTTGFRVFGIIASSLFSLIGFGYIKTHPEYVCTAAALIYLIGFGFMCMKVKEGDYPPPSDSLATPNPLKMIKVYATECFFHRIYIYYFLGYAFSDLFFELALTL